MTGGMAWPSIAIIRQHSKSDRYIYLASYAELGALAFRLLLNALNSGSFGRGDRSLWHVPTPEEIKALPEWAAPCFEGTAIKAENAYRRRVWERWERVKRIVSTEDARHQGLALIFVMSVCTKDRNNRAPFGGPWSPFEIRVVPLEPRTILKTWGPE